MLEKRKIEEVLTYVEPGPVTLISTSDGGKCNLMTITWTMASSFSQDLVITSGPWNMSFETIIKTKECVVAIPPVSLLRTAVEIGMVSGRDVDKFKRFQLTPIKGEVVESPLIEECLASIECTLTEHIERYGFLVLKARRLWVNPALSDRRICHAVSDGTFYADGERFDFRSLMEDKLPPGL